MPRIGLGTCCGLYNVTEWIRQGGCHLDSAVDYGSQGAIGDAVRASIAATTNKREDFWVTSKLDNEDYGADSKPGPAPAMGGCVFTTGLP